MSEALRLACHGCGTAMSRVMEVEESKEGPRIDVYQCPQEDCRRKVDVIFEPVGGMSEDQKTWVEREVARTGAFFPADYGGGGFRGGGGHGGGGLR